MGVGFCNLLLELLFETGRADVSVRGMAAGNAVGGHRTLNKTDHLFAGLSPSLCAWAREMLNLTATRECSSWLEKHIPNQAIRRRAMEF